MLASTWFGAAVAAIAGLSGPATATPAPYPSAAIIPAAHPGRPLNDLRARDPMAGIHEHPELARRASIDFRMDHTWNNKTLFDGNNLEPINGDDGGHGSETTSLSVTCVECWTKGEVTARLTTEDIFKPVLRLEFHGVEAYVDVAIMVADTATYTINLYASESPLGVGLPGLSVGLVFYVDLVFSLSAKIDLEGGFYVTLADDAYLDTDIFDGDIADSFFDGMATKSLPVTVSSGSANFKADLRLRVQCGAEVGDDLLGLGAGAVVGIFANIAEFVAHVDSTPDSHGCQLQATEWFDLNVGAYAHIGFEVDFTTVGVVPTVSTTLFNSPTLTQCWIDGSSAEPGQPGKASSSPIPPEHASSSSARGDSAPTPASTMTTALVSTLSAYPTSSAFPGGSSFPSRPHYTFLANSTASFRNSSSTGTSLDLVTSTVYSTAEYTITSCAAAVVNCPASLQKHLVVTKTVNAYTAVCLAGESVAYPTTSSTLEHEGHVAAASPADHVVGELAVLSRISPIVETFCPTSSDIPMRLPHDMTTSTVSRTMEAAHAPESITISTRSEASQGMGAAQRPTGALAVTGAAPKAKKMVSCKATAAYGLVMYLLVVGLW